MRPALKAGLTVDQKNPTVFMRPVRALRRALQRRLPSPGSDTSKYPSALCVPANAVLRVHPIGLLRTHFRLAVFGFLLDGVFRLPLGTDGMASRSFGSSLATNEPAVRMFK